MVHFETNVYKKETTGVVGCTVTCIDDAGIPVGDIHITEATEWEKIIKDIEHLKLEKVDETYMIGYITHLLLDYLTHEEAEKLYVHKKDLETKEDKINKTDSFKEISSEKYPNLPFFKTVTDNKEDKLIFTGEKQNIKTVGGSILRGAGDIPLPEGVIVDTEWIPGSKNAIQSCLIKKELDTKQPHLIEGADYLNPEHVSEKAKDIADTEIQVSLDIHNQNLDHLSHVDKQDLLIDDKTSRPEGVESNFKTVAGQSLLGSGGDIEALIEVDDHLDNESTNPVMNRVLLNAFDEKQDYLIDDITREDQNLKTINHESLLGKGNLDIKGSKIDTELNDTSTNAVQNKTIKKAIDKKQDYLIDDSTEHPGIISNIKTINKTSLLGAGDIQVSGEVIVDDHLDTSSKNPVQNKIITTHFDTKQDLLESGVNIKTINKQNILGNGDITIKGGDLIEGKDYLNPEHVQSRCDKAQSKAEAAAAGIAAAEAAAALTGHEFNPLCHGEKFAACEAAAIAAASAETTTAITAHNNLPTAHPSLINPIRNRLSTVEDNLRDARHDIGLKQNKLRDKLHREPGFAKNLKTVNGTSLLIDPRMQEDDDLVIDVGGECEEAWVEDSRKPLQSRFLKREFDKKLSISDCVDIEYSEETKRNPFTSNYVNSALGKKYDKDNIDKEIIQDSENPVQSKALQKWIREQLFILHDKLGSKPLEDGGLN